MIGGEKLSITTGCLNRLDQLRQSLPTWLAHSVVDEILIVDWGNKVPLWDELSSVDDRRVRILRAVDRKHWENSRCHNLELRFAAGDLILRLDADHMLKSDFFVKHPIRPGEHVFYAGNWKTVPKEVDDKRNLSGAIFGRAVDLLCANGYNERLFRYGHEDDDFCERLASTGTQRRDIDINTMEHIFHADARRYEHLDIAPKLSKLVTSRERRVSWSVRVANSPEKTYLIHESQEEARKHPWTYRDRLTRWGYREVGDRRFECKVLGYTAPGWRLVESPHQKTWESVPGHFDFDDIYLEAIDRAKAGAHFVELGVLFGRSTIFMAEEIRKSRKPIAFDAVDPFYDMNLWEEYERIAESYYDYPWYRERVMAGSQVGSAHEIVRGTLRDLGLIPYVRVIKALGQDVASSYRDRSLDLVFIDADHTADGTETIIRAFLPKMKVGGLLAGHDYEGRGPDGNILWPGVKVAVQKVFGRDYAVRRCSFAHSVKRVP